MAQTEQSKRIKELRLINGMSQDQLSDKSGLSLRTVQRVENGQRIPRGDTLSRLASAFEVSTEEIMDLHSLGDDHENRVGKGFTNIFDNWKRLLYFYILSISILAIGIYFKNNLIGMIWLIVCVIELLLLSFSIVYQFSKKRWMAGILTSVIVFSSIMLFIGFFTEDTSRSKPPMQHSTNSRTEVRKFHKSNLTTLVAQLDNSRTGIF